MSNLRWIGGAQNVAQVSSCAVTGYDAATSYRVTIGLKAVSVAGTGGTTAATAAALQAALAASTEPEFTAVSWTVNSSTVTGTAATVGVPFTATSSVSGGAGTIGAFSTGTASAGPNDVSTPGNWSGGSLPVNSDNVTIDYSDFSLLYGLSALSGVTLASLTITQTFTGTIGLPKATDDGTIEFRPDYWAISATTLVIGSETGSGSGRIKLDLGSVACTATVYNSGSPAEANLEAVLLKGTSASNSITVQRGSVGIAVFGNETSNVSGGLQVGYVTSPTSDANVRCGSGVTLATITKSGGVLEVNSAIGTLLKQFAGTTSIFGTGAVAQLTLLGGTVIYCTSGTLNGNTVLGEGALLDFSQDQRVKTIAAPVDLYSGTAAVNDPNVVVTGGSNLILDYNNVAVPGLPIGPNVRVTRGTPA
jgi:hypothetical protein